MSRHGAHGPSPNEADIGALESRLRVEFAKRFGHRLRTERVALGLDQTVSLVS